MMIDNITYGSIILILFITIFLILIITLNLNKKIKSVYKYIINCLTLFITIVVVVIGLIAKTESGSLITNVNLKYENHLQDISLMKSDDSNYLYDNLNQEMIEHLDVNTIYMPVYLKDLDNYYLVVYSVNNDLYENGLFRMSDYETYENIDWIVIIEKTTGVITIIREYHHIGRTFNLELATSGANNILLPVLIPHEKEVGSYIVIVIPENARYRNDYYSIRSMKYYYYQENEPYIYYKDNIIDKDGRVLSVDSEDNVILQVHDIRVEGPEVSSKSQSFDQLFNEEKYVKEGYYKKYLGEIYYLDNNLNVKKIVDENNFVTIKELNNINEWESFDIN